MPSYNTETGVQLICKFRTYLSSALVLNLKNIHIKWMYCFPMVHKATVVVLKNCYIKMKHHKSKQCNKHINAHKIFKSPDFQQKCGQFVGVWSFSKGTHLHKNIHRFKHSILHLGHNKTLYSFSKYRACVDLRLT